MKNTEPIRDKNQIRELVEYYLKRGQIRNHVLIVMALYTILRISDLLQLRWDDVYDFKNQRFRKNITLIEKRQARQKQSPLMQI